MELTPEIERYFKQPHAPAPLVLPVPKNEQLSDFQVSIRRVAAGAVLTGIGLSTIGSPTSAMASENPGAIGEVPSGIGSNRIVSTSSGLQNNEFGFRDVVRLHAPSVEGARLAFDDSSRSTMPQSSAAISAETESLPDQAIETLSHLRRSVQEAVVLHSPTASVEQTDDIQAVSYVSGLNVDAPTGSQIVRASEGPSKLDELGKLGSSLTQFASDTLSSPLESIVDRAKSFGDMVGAIPSHLQDHDSSTDKSAGIDAPITGSAIQTVPQNGSAARTIQQSATDAKRGIDAHAAFGSLSSLTTRPIAGSTLGLQQPGLAAAPRLGGKDICSPGDELHIQAAAFETFDSAQTLAGQAAEKSTACAIDAPGTINGLIPGHATAGDMSEQASATFGFGDVSNIAFRPVLGDLLTYAQDIIAAHTKPGMSARSTHRVPTPQIKPQAPHRIALQGHEKIQRGLSHEHHGVSGKLSKAELDRIGPEWGRHQLYPDAAKSFRVMSDAYEKKFGEPIQITDSYRSYQGQVSCRRRKGNMCAVPGTSEHGWGMAIDAFGGINNFGTPQHNWMLKHAPEFGWTHPRWARANGSKPEPWHFEYRGGKVIVSKPKPHASHSRPVHVQQPARPGESPADAEGFGAVTVASKEVTGDSLAIDTTAPAPDILTQTPTPPSDAIGLPADNYFGFEDPAVTDDVQVIEGNTLTLPTAPVPDNKGKDKPKDHKRHDYTPRHAQPPAPGIPTSEPSSNKGHARELYVMDRIVRHHNRTPVEAAGIVGNLRWESGMNPGAEQGSGDNGKGMAQWSEHGRWQKLLKWAAKHGRDPYSSATQTDYIMYEMEHVAPWNKTLPALERADTAEEAAIAFQDKFEKPGIPHTDKRVAFANDILERYKKNLNRK